MNDYDELLNQACEEGIEVISSNFESDNLKGLYCDKVIGLSNNLVTTAERTCVLAEEMGHHYTTVGNIIDQSTTCNRKQEQQARMWAYNQRIGLMGIVKAYQAGCRSLSETAEYLNVTEAFLTDALIRYKEKYGLFAAVDNYIVYFEPYITVTETNK